MGPGGHRARSSVRRLWDLLASLPTLARWGILSAASLVLIVLVGAGVWTFLQHRDAVARRAFLTVTQTYSQAMANGQEQALAGAAETIRQFLRGHPRSSVAAQAWYSLGNLEYQRRSLDAALAAFAEASRRDSASVGSLSRLGVGYVWEAKGDPARALEAYQSALGGRDPKDFLYGELILATARVQEELKQPGAAIESYKRFLQSAPSSARAEEVRIRLAILGTGG